MVATKEDEVGRCIYCGSTDDLTDEHIIPYGLGSTWVLRKASCRKCATITGRFEGEVLRPMLGELRAALGMKTRRRSERPTTSRLLLETNGLLQAVSMPVKDCVQVLPLPVFPPPGYSEGRSLDEKLRVQQIELNTVRASKSKALGKDRGADAIRRPFSCRSFAFAQLICKIAHAAAVDLCGLDSFGQFYLLQTLLEADDHVGFFVGSGRLASQPATGDHSVGVYSNEGGFVVAQVDLFLPIAGTSYLALVGRLRKPKERQGEVKR